MTRTIILYIALSFWMSSCVSVSVLTDTPTVPHFVTATLPPTKLVVPRAASTSSPVPAAQAATVTDGAPCKTSAVLLEDVTVPDNSRVPAGESFTKTWRFKNTGTCPWAGFTIQYASGERMDAPGSLPVAETAAGSTVDVSVELTAPTSDGTYTTHFSLRSGTGEPIGIGAQETFYVQVIVGAGGAAAQSAPPAQQPSTSSGAAALSVGTTTIFCTYSYSENAAYVQELAALINQARADAGLAPLGLNPLLTQAAQGHSIDMACNNFLSHASSNGSPFGALVRASGYNHSFQEIIAIGTPQNAIDQWYADPGHWEIVLNALASEMGVGYAYNPASDFGGYFTVDLH